MGELILSPELNALPASLKAWAAAQLGLSEAAGGGISSGGGHPRVSLSGRQFTALTESEEKRVGSFNQADGIFLEVIVVGANPAVSKTYYDKPFDPTSTEPTAPTCFSDNGVGPSVSATSPQSDTCAACRHNVWGSRVTQGGSQVKACADSKKIAVILTEDIKGPVYELRIPAKSMKPFAATVGDLKARGVPLPMVVLTITFDSAETYPKVNFRPQRYVNASAELPVVQDTIASRGDDIAVAVGTSDKAKPAGGGSNVVELQHSLPLPEQQKRGRGRPPASAPQAPAPASDFGRAPMAFDDAPGVVPTTAPSDAALDGLLSGINLGA